MEVSQNIILEEPLQPDGTEKKVYKLTEIRDLETKRLVERQERIVENY